MGITLTLFWKHVSVVYPLCVRNGVFVCILTCYWGHTCFLKTHIYNLSFDCDICTFLLANKNHREYSVLIDIMLWGWFSLSGCWSRKCRFRIFKRNIYCIHPGGLLIGPFFFRGYGFTRCKRGEMNTIQFIRILMNVHQLQGGPLYNSYFKWSSNAVNGLINGQLGLFHHISGVISPYNLPGFLAHLVG